jgi:hypothetical protein
VVSFVSFRIGLANFDDTRLRIRRAESLGTPFLRQAVTAITRV